MGRRGEGEGGSISGGEVSKHGVHRPQKAQGLLGTGISRGQEYGGGGRGKNIIPIATLSPPE